MNPADQCDHDPYPCVLEITPVCAQLVGVTPGAIRTWAHRSWITRRGTLGRHAQYCVHQIRTAEAREQRRIQGYA